MATRHARARQIIARQVDRIKLRGNTEIAIPSQTYPRVRYRVGLVRRGAQRVVATGDCKDYRYRDPVGGCKHMRAATMYLNARRPLKRWDGPLNIKI
jgi:hypothetical protein